MNAAIRALGWELWARNRWGLVALLAIWLMVCSMAWASHARLSWLQQAQRESMESTERATEKLHAKLREADEPEVRALRAEEAAKVKHLRELQGRGGVLMRRFGLMPTPGGRAVVPPVRSEAAAATSPETLKEIADTQAALTEVRNRIFERTQRNPATAESRRLRNELSEREENYHIVSMQLQSAASWVDVVRAMAVVSLGGVFLAVCGVMARTEANSVRGFSGMPTRLFTLPVSTRDLVRLPVGVGVLVLWLVYALWRWGAFPALELPALTAVADCYSMLVIASVFMAFLGVVWGFVGFPKLRVVLLIGLLVLVALGLSVPYVYAEGFGRFGSLWCAGLALALVGLFAWVELAVERTRHGEWAGWSWWGRLAAQLSDRLVIGTEWRSPEAAQFWLEARRLAVPTLIGYGPAILVAMVFTFYGVRTARGMGTPEFNAVAMADQVRSFYSASLFLVTFLGAAYGLVIAGDSGRGGSQMGTFIGVRPLSAGRMVEAKLRALFGMLALVLGATWVVGTVVLCGGTWVLMSGDSWSLVWGRVMEGILEPWGSQRGGDQILVVIGYAVLLLQLGVGVLPLVLSGRVPGLPWSILYLIAYGVGVVQVISGLLSGDGYFRMHGYDPEFVLMGIILMKVGVAYWGFRTGWRQGIIGSGLIGTAAAIWVVLAWGFSLAAMAVPGLMQTGDGFRATLVIMTLIPLVRVAWAPVALEANRRR